MPYPKQQQNSFHFLRGVGVCVCVVCFFFHLLGLLPSAIPQAATNLLFFHLLGLLPRGTQAATECFSRLSLLLSQCMKGREDEML